MAEYGAGEILLTSMDRDGTKAGYDIALTRAVADAVRGAGDRLGRRRHARPLVAGCATATRPRCSPPRSSISAPTRIGEAKAHMKGRHGGALSGDAEAT